MRKVYKLKHKPTGLYFIKSGYGHLSDKGSVYTTGVNSLSGRQGEMIDLYVSDQKIIKKNMAVLQTVGILETIPHARVWNSRLEMDVFETRYYWHMKSPVSDFEKEIIAEIQ